MKSIYTIIITTTYSTHTISEFFLGGMLENVKEGGCAPSLQNLPLPVCLMQCFSMTLLQTLINLYATEWDVQNLKYYLQNGLYCYHFEL